MTRRKPEPPSPPEPRANVEVSMEEAEAIVQVARERAELLQRLKDALERRDDRAAIKLARQATGLDEEELLQ